MPQFKKLAKAPINFGDMLAAHLLPQLAHLDPNAQMLYLRLFLVAVARHPPLLLLRLLEVVLVTTAPSRVPDWSKQSEHGFRGFFRSTRSTSSGTSRTSTTSRISTLHGIRAVVIQSQQRIHKYVLSTNLQLCLARKRSMRS